MRCAALSMSLTRTRQIRDTLTPYVTSLLDGMQPVIKLPLFDYGSAGALGFYQLQLKDLMYVRGGAQQRRLSCQRRRPARQMTSSL